MYVFGTDSSCYMFFELKEEILILNTWRKILFIALFAIFSVILAACGGGEKADGSKDKKDKTFVFADAGFDSLVFHNEVARFILEKGYGYKTDQIPGSTTATIQGLETGDIDIYMEVWTDNVMEVYQKALDSGNAVEVGLNYDDNRQGFYVPTYMIEGDKERGIEPMAPGLKSVEDLPKYKDLFKDPEDPSKGRIVGSIPGWEVDKIVTEKVENYGLDKHFNLFRPGSEAALSTSIAKAYEEGKPWVGYYWEPTWIMGMYDLTLLEEAEYNEEQWEKDRLTAFPSIDLTKAVNKEVYDNYPDVVEFIENYQSSSELVNEALAYMQENDASSKDAAIYFLKEHEDLWTEWVPEDVAKKVKEAL